jgi:hypothetical protein
VIAREDFRREPLAPPGVTAGASSNASSKASPDRLEVVCNDWSREDLIALLATLKSVRTGRVEIMLREHRVVGVVRHPFPFAGRVHAG